MEKDYGLLLASIVAIVAIVGLVVYFGGSSSGALYFPVGSTAAQQHYVNLGTEVGAAYPGVVESHDWCSKGCMEACSGKPRHTLSECHSYCRTQCNYVTLEQLQLA